MSACAFGKWSLVADQMKKPGALLEQLNSCRYANTTKNQTPSYSLGHIVILIAAASKKRILTIGAYLVTAL